MKHQNDFCVLILSHGRPQNVITVRTLQRFGYTGDWFILLDDLDPTIEDYKKEFGEEHIIVFNKEWAMSITDSMDNFGYHKSIVYARQACIPIVKDLGYRYFAEYEDDYDSFRWRMSPEIEYSSKMLSDNPEHRVLDRIFDTMIDYLIETPKLKSICMAQSGDYIGGGGSRMVQEQSRRKVMNTWIIDTERPFDFYGTMNDDVTAYTTHATRGELFLTTGYVAVNQRQTQSNSSGNTDMYKQFGTYVKSFYSVMSCPSGVKVAVLFNTSARKAVGPKTNNTFRLHHQVDWKYVAPKILKASIKKSLTQKKLMV